MPNVRGQPPHRSSEVPGVRQSTLLSVLQLNTNRCKDALDLLTQRVREQGVDVALIAEQYQAWSRISRSSQGRWVEDPSKKAAIYACGDLPIQMIRSIDHVGLVVVDIGGVTFASCYAPPKCGMDHYRGLLDALLAAIRGRPKVVVGGDFNAWAEDWGSRSTNARGLELLAAMDCAGLTLLNRGTIPTYLGRCGQHTSIVDVTFASPSVAGLGDWRVDPQETGSDHAALCYTVGTSLPMEQPRTSGWPAKKGIATGWVMRQFDAESFEIALEALRFGEVTADAASVTDGLTNACSEIMAPSRAGGRRSRQAYWWSDELAELRATCTKARRRLHSTKNAERRVQRLAEYRSARKALRVAIRRSKRQKLKELASLVEDDPWGVGYRVAMSQVRGNRLPQETDPVIMSKIVDDLFPQHSPMEWPTTALESAKTVVRPVTTEELLDIASSLNSAKAPGPDGIPNAAVATAIRLYPNVFQGMFQRYLDDGEFPDEWKLQRLVLLPKPGKPPGMSSSSRPLCMLNTVGKVFERIILERLNDTLERDPDGPRLSEQQYGFRKGRSTVDAIQQVVQYGEEWRKSGAVCMAVALDVKNAFNSASWTRIGSALQAKGCPERLLKVLASYFRGRRLVYNTDAGQMERVVTAGVPQGSILGPTLWNTMYDGVLEVPLPERVRTIAFADDVILLVPGANCTEAVRTAQVAIEAIHQWMEQNSLKLALDKTEALIFKRGQTSQGRRFKARGVDCYTTETIRYLGVVLQENLQWQPHVKYATEKASKASKALRLLMPRHGGPSCTTRLLLASAAISAIRYAAPAWARAVRQKGNPGMLNAAQRLSAIAATSAFRTVAHWNIALVAGMTPICLLLLEDQRCHEYFREEHRLQRVPQASEVVRRREHLATIQQWQSQWDAGAVGRGASRYAKWTHRVIPEVGAWIGRKHGQVDFFLAQVLTGHGFFREYFNVMSIASSPDCTHCPGVVESVEHVMFECPRFVGIREEMTHGGERPLCAELLSSCERWKEISRACQAIMRQLQRRWDQDRAAAARDPAAAEVAARISAATDTHRRTSRDLHGP
uniref:Putative r1-6 dk n=1 Tax=Anopheles triannulatus TaxID=58253 RepID=A0A2M4AK35_9DIPT